MSNIDKLLYIIDNLLNTKYKWWHKYMEDCGEQSYAKNGDIPDFETIKNIGINCVGVINLIRRYIGLDIPGYKENKSYAGGTYEWYKYLNKNKKLKKFNYKKEYPIGTLLIRKYMSETDQGHVAVIYKNNPKGVLFSQLAHAYCYTEFNENDINKKLSPGLNIDLSVGASHFWFPEGTYTHICYPQDWLTISS